MKYQDLIMVNVLSSLLLQRRSNFGIMSVNELSTRGA